MTVYYAARQVLLEGQVPPRPTGFTDRPEETQKVREALYQLKDHYGWVILHGMGGCGKTILAAESLRDPTLLRKCFPSGVFWVTIGQVSDDQKRIDQSRLLTKMANLCSRLDEVHRLPPTNIEEAHDRLHDIFIRQYPRSLLVLDDVWSQTVARWFAVRCRVLVTTRDRTVTDQARIGDNKRIFVSIDSGLKVSEARAVLSSWTGISDDQLPNEANTIISECDSSPLAIAMIGALLQKDPKQAKWEYYNQNLRNRKLHRIKRPIEYEYPALDASIGVSIEALAKDQQERYHQLAVFEDDANLSSEVLAVLWNDSPMVIEEEYMSDFVNKSLVRRLPSESDQECAMYAIHDLQLDYLKEIGNTKEQLCKAHSQFVDNYSLKCSGEFSELPDDGYVHHNLIMHILKAGRKTDAAHLLTDLQWIESKLRVCGPSEAIVDYLRFQSLQSEKQKCPGGRRTTQLRMNIQAQKSSQRSFSSQALKLNNFQRFISTNAHLFVDPKSFPDIVQLALEQPEKSEVYQQGMARAQATLMTNPDQFYVNWINERSGAEWHLMTMKVGEDPVRFAAFSNDAMSLKIITCSDNLSVEVRSSQTGGDKVSYEGHNDIPYHASFSPDGNQIVSCSEDGAIRVWSIWGGNTHELLQIPGHEQDQATFRCAFSPDGNRIVSCSENGSIKVWDSTTGKEALPNIVGHTEPVRVCSYSPNGKMIASASVDKTVKVGTFNHHMYSVQL
jgi:apoptotic protease-activating factor